MGDEEKHWIVGGLRAILKRRSDGTGGAAWGPHEKDAVLASAVIAEAAAYEADIMRVGRDAPKQEATTIQQKLGVHPKVARWAWACANAGIDMDSIPGNQGSAASKPDYPWLGLRHEHWLSGLFALRNLLLHPDEPSNFDKKHLDRLRDVRLAHDLGTLDERFLDEAAYRWTVIGPTFHKIATRRAKPGQS